MSSHKTCPNEHGPARMRAIKSLSDGTRALLDLGYKPDRVAVICGDVIDAQWGDILDERRRAVVLGKPHSKKTHSR